MAIASVVVGVIAILGMFIGMVPCLGWFNWLNIPLGVIGLALGAAARSKAAPGTAGMANFGIALNAIAVVLGILRLKLGGGVI